MNLNRFGPDNATSMVAAAGPLKANMPWSEDDYPASMRHLSGVTRAKAIEIANALLAEGMDEGRAIRIAIARAEQWSERRRLPVRDDD